jgi:hypothetical protein
VGRLLVAYLFTTERSIHVGLAGPTAITSAVLLMEKQLRTVGGLGHIEDGAERDMERGTALEQADELHPEILAFARWFVEWWLRRGCDLLTAAEADDDRRAA